MSRWFRHYAGLCRDDKLVRVALRAKQPVERVVWVWAAILESASEVNDNGRYDFDIGEASYFLRADESDVRRICDALEDLERVREGMVVRWGDRQFTSDTSAERQKRYRDRKKTSNQDNGDGVVTSPSRHGDAPETETETELEKDLSLASLARAPDEPVAVIPVPSDAERKAKASEKVALIQTVVGGWNKLASDWRLPPVRDITEPRQRAILARSKDLTDTYDFTEPIAGYEALFAKVRASPFLRGEKGFRVDFDFLIKQSSFTKIMEGKYEADAHRRA